MPILGAVSTEGISDEGQKIVHHGHTGATKCKLFVRHTNGLSRFI